LEAQFPLPTNLVGVAGTTSTSSLMEQEKWNGVEVIPTAGHSLSRLRRELRIFWCSRREHAIMRVTRQSGTPFTNESKDCYYAKESGA
jgi:hypothetical protein